MEQSASGSLAPGQAGQGAPGSAFVDASSVPGAWASSRDEVPAQSVASSSAGSNGGVLGGIQVIGMARSDSASSLASPAVAGVTPATAGRSSSLSAASGSTAQATMRGAFSPSGVVAELPSVAPASVAARGPGGIPRSLSHKDSFGGHAHSASAFSPAAATQQPRSMPSSPSPRRQTMPLLHIAASSSRSALFEEQEADEAELGDPEDDEDADVASSTPADTSAASAGQADTNAPMGSLAGGPLNPARIAAEAATRSASSTLRTSTRAAAPSPLKADALAPTARSAELLSPAAAAAGASASPALVSPAVSALQQSDASRAASASSSPTSSSRRTAPEPPARTPASGLSGSSKPSRAAAASSAPSASSAPAAGSGSNAPAAASTSSRLRMPAPRAVPQLPSAPGLSPAPPTAMYWSKAPVHGSVPRRAFRAHTASLCEEVLWLFGGCDSKGCFRELWCFDTETMCWSKPKVTGDLPPPRRAHTATMVEKRLFVFAGGDGPHYFNDLYVFDTVALRWSKPEVYGTPPSPRRAHTSNYYQGQLIIFGGGNGVGALNDVYSLDIQDLDRLEWRRVECRGKMPIGRGYHTSNFVDGKLIVIGGSDGHMSFNDIHILRFDTKVWYQVKTDEIHSRLGHTATQVGSYLFIIGGHDSHSYTPDILTLNLVNLQWEPRRVCGRKPPGRGYHQAWLRDSRLFLHGGFDGKEIFDDMYFVDLAACAYLPQITSFGVELDDE